MKEEKGRWPPSQQVEAVPKEETEPMALNITQPPHAKECVSGNLLLIKIVHIYLIN